MRWPWSKKLPDPLLQPVTPGLDYHERLKKVVDDAIAHGRVFFGIIDYAWMVQHPEFKEAVIQKAREVQAAEEAAESARVERIVEAVLTRLKEQKCVEDTIPA